MRFSLVTMAGVVLILAGCTGSQDKPSGGSETKTASFGKPEETQKPSKSDDEDQEPAEKMVRKEAEAGDRKKGHYSRGFITTPVAVYFSVEAKLALAQERQALDLYKAMNGQAPKTHEEYMEKVIGYNKIQLPELADGSRYLYDPKTEKLLVEHPAE